MHGKIEHSWYRSEGRPKISPNFQDSHTSLHGQPSRDLGEVLAKIVIVHKFGGHPKSETLALKEVGPGRGDILD